jgi:eukaryotic-like serine/threonine-protein kinase
MGLKPGESFDRYIIEAPLGQGGMGEVYRAYDPRLRRNLALKVLTLGEEGADPAIGHVAAERVLREARNAAALDHPNAVSVFDVGEVHGRPYIAMELVKGLPLRDYIGDPAVPYDRRVRWLVDVARALSAAHERGLVHRDVKPENVMVRDDGVIKVLDFGIAKQMLLDKEPRTAIAAASAGTAPTLRAGSETIRGAMLGTPRYFAPEQVTGDPVDGRTDQFAWGVMAYELLHGRPPWDEQKGVMPMLNAISTLEPPSLARLVPNLPSAVARTVTIALSKQPQRRFQRMSEIVAALEPFEANSMRSIPLSPVTSKRDSKIAELETARAPLALDDEHPAPEDEPEAPPPSQRLAPPPTPPRRGWLLGTMIAAMSVVVVVAAVRGNPPAQAKLPTTANLLAPAPTAVTDLPPPTSSNAEAVAAYRAAMQAFRDGTFGATRDSLARAVALDPSMAAAHLRLAIFGSLVEGDEPEAKKSYRRASQFRGFLTERDKLLLEALEPYFQRDPSEPTECERRLRAVAERFPDDAELWYYVGWIRYDYGKLSSALEAFERAIKLDQKFALAWANKGGIEAYLGDYDRALKSLDQCLEISPQATESLWYRTLIFEQEGACAREEADARRWIVKDADDFFAYAVLARALDAEGRPREAVVAVLEQKWAHLAPSLRPRREILDRAYIDVLNGDFDAAEKGAFELERVVAGEPGAAAHADPARLLVEIYRETGRDAAARKVADRYVKRRDAWEPAHRVDDGAIESDPIPQMLGVLRHTGGLDEAGFRQKRQEWLNVWETKTVESFFPYVWVYAYALPAETPDEAREALAALPKYSPLPAFLPQTLGVAHIGQTYLRAGQLDEALPYLKKAAASCVALYRPFTHTQVHRSLGDALAAKGDRAGACAAYQVVVGRWGKDARSVTAQAARAGRAKLRCD